MPDETMIFRVARAIDQLAWSIPEDDYPAEKARREAKQSASLQAARRAIEAMITPTEKMREAFDADFSDWFDEKISDPYHLYKVMILSELG